MSGVSEKDKFQYFAVPDTPKEFFIRAGRAITRFAKTDEERAMFLEQILGDEHSQALGT